MSKIEIKHLGILFSLIIDRLNKVYGDSIEFDGDYYWSLAEDEKYRLSEEPKEFLLEQISFDLENLERLKKKPNELISNDLIKIAEVLMLIRKESKGIW